MKDFFVKNHQKLSFMQIFLQNIMQKLENLKQISETDDDSTKGNKPYMEIEAVLIRSTKQRQLKKITITDDFLPSCFNKGVMGLWGLFNSSEEYTYYSHTSSSQVPSSPEQSFRENNQTISLVMAGLINKISEQRQYNRKIIEDCQQKMSEMRKKVQIELKKLRVQYEKEKNECANYLEKLRFSLECWGIGIKQTIKELKNKNTLDGEQKEDSFQDVKKKIQYDFQKAHKQMDENKLVGRTKRSQSRGGLFFNEQNIVIYKGTGNGFHQYLHQQTIKGDRVIKLKLKIISSQSNFIMIGVTIRKRIGEKSSFESGEAIAYQGNNSFIWLGRGKKLRQGSGFRNGDIITMTIDIKKDFIQWDVNEQPAANHKIGSYRFEKLVPYVQMYHPNDMIQWL